MVDFPSIFPRMHCKGEDAGWAMMDIGVSAISFAAGFSNSLITLHDTPSKPPPNIFTRLWRALTANILVTVMASIRFVVLKNINYQDHVTEWGTHWNFYVTIGVITVLMAFINSSRFALALGLILLLGDRKSVV